MQVLEGDIPQYIRVIYPIISFSTYGISHLVDGTVPGSGLLVDFTFHE